MTESQSLPERISALRERLDAAILAVRHARSEASRCRMELQSHENTRAVEEKSVQDLRAKLDDLMDEWMAAK